MSHKLYNDNYNKNIITKQDIISNDIHLIKEKLLGFKKVEEEEIEHISLGVWIKYLNENGKYRSGGVLIVNNYPTYIVLKNPSQNKSWSVNLKKNIIFISELKRNNVNKEIEKEKNILYKLYKKGLLEIIDEPN